MEYEQLKLNKWHSKPRTKYLNQKIHYLGSSDGFLALIKYYIEETI